MKRLGYKEVLVSNSDLVDLSLSVAQDLAYVNTAKSRSKLAKSNSWVVFDDGGVSQLKYSTIPCSFKTKHGLPSVEQLIERIKLNTILQVEEQKQDQKDLNILELESLLAAASNTRYTKYCPQYNTLFPGKPDKVILLAKTHAVLQCCIDIDSCGKYFLSEIHTAYLTVPNIRVSLKSYHKFRIKIREFQKDGIRIVHKYTGKAHDHIVKLTPWHVGKIEQYYSHPNKYTSKMIHELLTADSIEAGKAVISVQSVARYVANPEVKNRLSVYRDKAYYNRVVKPYTRRKDPTYSGDLYYADGSPVQIFCLSPDGKEKIRLNLFIVLDVKSKKVVGYDLAINEDRHNWFSAFKMAFTREMFLPYELMHDNAGATKTPEFETLKKELELRGCRLSPTTKGEPKQKADVERWFGTFQSGFQRMIDGFIGEGIRSKRDNGRIDVEHLSGLQKRNGLYSYTDMKTIVDGLILIYNNKAEGKRKAPAKVFSESERPNVTTVGHSDIAMLFWHHKKLKVQNSEIAMTIRHNDYFFEVYEHATALKLDGTKVNVYYDDNDLSTVHVFGLNGTYICECRQKIAFHKAKANQTEVDVIQIIRQTSHNESKKTIAKKLSQDVAGKAIETTGEDFLKMANPYEVNMKDVLNDAETQAELRFIRQYNGTGDLNDYTPVEVESIAPVKRKKQSIQERHAKQNIVPATLEIINRKV